MDDIKLITRAYSILLSRLIAIIRAGFECKQSSRNKKKVSWHIQSDVVPSKNLWLCYEFVFVCMSQSMSGIWKLVTHEIEILQTNHCPRINFIIHQLLYLVIRLHSVKSDPQTAPCDIASTDYVTFVSQIICDNEYPLFTLQILINRYFTLGACSVVWCTDFWILLSFTVQPQHIY